MLLWFGPGLLMAGGLATLVIVLRRRSRMAPEAFEADATEDAKEADAPPAAR
jgi:cytochrome c-type biogenesis protein CcmH